MAKLLDLCPADKAKLANLMREAATKTQALATAEEDTRKLQTHNDTLASEAKTLRQRFTQYLCVLIEKG